MFLLAKSLKISKEHKIVDIGVAIGSHLSLCGPSCMLLNVLRVEPNLRKMMCQITDLNLCYLNYLKNITFN